ncbi:MAG: FkbM family methyltransferase [Gammaproteobacteria bacterium]|nr:FkbM family methyltransferase [Gammaproteobacteria bacterium]
MNRPWGAYRPDRWQKLLVNLCRHTSLGRGRARRFVRDRLVSSHLDTVDFEFPFAKFRLSLTGNACEWKLLLNSGYNRKESQFIRDELLKQPQGVRVFVDIGANVGMHTLAVHEYCDRILAIEPLDEAREKLEFNVSVNNAYDRITIIPFAISSNNEILRDLAVISMISADPI